MEKRIKNYIIWLLSKRDYTEKEIKEKINQRAFKDEAWKLESELIQKVIDQIKDLNLINDNNYSDRFVRYRYEQLYGKNKIIMDAKIKGLDIENIKKVFLNYDFFESALKYKDKIYNKNKSYDYKELNKLKEKMLRRGFDFEEIKESFKN